MILYLVILVLTILLAVVCFYCFKFAIIVLRIQDALQESLDILDSKHRRISDILQRPLFFDSPEIRQVLRDIEDSKKSLHSIALALSSDFKEDKEA
jgi:hypothetical protein